MYRTGIGQDSHRFLKEQGSKRCIIGGVEFFDVPGLDADSDGDVVLHAICNAITSITHVYVLGEIAPKMCRFESITNSEAYLQVALDSLQKQHKQIVHVALTIEAKQPRMQKRIVEIRQNVARLMHLREKDVGLTVTSGDHLSDFARGEGLQCFAIVTSVDI